MSKWYEVEVQTLVVYAVEVRDNQNEIDAIEVAANDCSRYGRRTFTAQPLPPEHQETFRKNANMVRTLDPHDDQDNEDYEAE